MYNEMGKIFLTKFILSVSSNTGLQTIPLLNYSKDVKDPVNFPKAN